MVKMSRAFSVQYGKKEKSAGHKALRTFCINENLPLGGRFKKAYSFAHVIKTPFDLLGFLCGLATALENKSKGGHDE